MAPPPLVEVNPRSPESCGGRASLVTSPTGPRPTPMTRTLLLFAALATAGSAQTTGTISADDPEFINGKPHDAYAVVLEAGDELSIEMTSTAVDTYLYLMSPSGRNLSYNDDCTRGDVSKSCLSFSAGQAGTYEVVATTYESGETGAYEIKILVNGEPAP